MGPTPSRSSTESDTISARRDPLRLTIWAAAVALVTAAFAVEPHRLAPAARSTSGPFLTLALVIAGGAIADRVGCFGLLARALIPEHASRRVAFAAVLALTAIVSGLVNLDVAVVVAIPLALRVADRNRLAAGWLVLAVAVTANATSFLLPSSNLTTLLMLSRAPLPFWTYLEDSWVAWLAVTILTVAGLATVLTSTANGETRAAGTRGSSIRAVTDLVPMYLGAAAIRTLVGPGLALGAGFVKQVAVGSVFAAAVNNLPAASALHAQGSTGPWAAVLAMAIGPNLLLTGSVATLICRRLASQGEVKLGAIRFSLLGSVVVPLQILVAAAGLRATGAIH